jgi:hypothetical protein
MATAFHNTVDLRGLHFEDTMVTMSLNAAIVKADEGKPVSIDVAANNRVKIAGNGDQIIGKLLVVEDRSVDGIKVGTIELRFVADWPILAADTLAVGDTAVGAGSGEVKKAAANQVGQNYVVSVESGRAVVVKV